MLIFIHGINANADEWQPLLKYFNNRKFSCEAVNLREGLDLRKTHFQDYVIKVKAMVTPNDILIGHSMGGLIVQKIPEETTIKGGIAICSVRDLNTSLPVKICRGRDLNSFLMVKNQVFLLLA